MLSQGNDLGSTTKHRFHEGFSHASIPEDLSIERNNMPTRAESTVYVCDVQFNEKKQKTIKIDSISNVRKW